MTDEEYRNVPDLADLPIVDEDSPFAETLCRPGPDSCPIHEAITVEDAESLLQDETWVAKGGVRYFIGDRTESVIHVVFHSRWPGGGKVPPDVLKRLAGH